MEFNFQYTMNEGNELLDSKRLNIWTDRVWADMGEESNNNTNSNAPSNKRKHLNSASSSQSSPPCWEESHDQNKYLRLESNANVPANVNSGQTRGSVKSGSQNLSGWQHVDDLANNLAADFDGNFTALGVDLNGSSYINDELLSLPSLTVFKQETPSPHLVNQNENSNSRGADDSSSYRHQSSPYNTDGSDSSNHLEELVTLCPHSNSNEVTSTGSPCHNTVNINPEDIRFQYVLSAATSIATKINEESLTYLNQGQSYEIKFKKTTPCPTMRGKILKSIVRVSFHDRRLQYTEREQMTLWRASRPGDRILEVDLPLSYGVHDLVQDAASCNTIQFLWDPNKDVGVYIKVNCISTEFTPKKHGGEKGVPFRIQVDTFIQEKLPRHLHSASCQIKVFKLKGADRKHKQDKEKIMKRPLGEQDRYQKSYEYTVLTEVAYTVDNPPPATPMSVSPHVDSTDYTHEPNNFELIGSNNVKEDISKGQDLDLPEYQDGFVPLKREFSANQVQTWLQSRDFGAFLVTFANYNGVDMLRLSKEDLKTLCGLSEGIRLFNLLHPELVAHKLTIYLLVDTDSMVYHPIFLYRMTTSEICSKLVNLLGMSQSQIADFYLQGPNDIHVIITDELVKHIKNESMFSVDVLQDLNGTDRYRLLLKPMNTPPQPATNT